MIERLTLVGVKSAAKIDEGTYQLVIDVEGSAGPETFDFVYRPDDPYGLSPQVKQWFEEFGGLPE